MISYYLVLLFILLSFGVFNLFWRVRNDAVIFLHSTLGSKIAPTWLVLLVAGLGLFTGAFFSQEMLMIVRNGIFRPEMFAFADIMVIFTAMIVTDVILLNILKAMDFPSSTIVMVLSELLGSSVAVSLVKIKSAGLSFLDLPKYIHSKTVLLIIVGIFGSVILALILGAFVQFLVRLLFTFRYRKNFRFWGPLYGAVMITVVSWLILIKGWEGSVFVNIGGKTEACLLWARQNFWSAMAGSFLVWTVVFWILKLLFRIDILKLIILVGTFCLTLSIASNEMVNFIGVPISGFESFEAWIGSGIRTAENFQMDYWAEDIIDTPPVLLIIVGMIMTVALFTRKRGERDPEAILNPVRKNEWEDRFFSILFARQVTRSAIVLNRRVKRAIPNPVNRIIQSRFEHLPLDTNKDQQVLGVEKIRASVTLFVASVIIAFSTSLDLPLPTSYVVFMVILGSSLADRAWGRDSAVYRISGILSTLGNTLITALVAFTVSAFMAWIIIVGGVLVNTGLILAIAVIVIRSQLILRRKNRKLAEDEELINEKDEKEKWIDKCSRQVVKTILSSNKIFSFALESFLREDRSHMHETMQMNNELNRKSKKQKNKIIQTISSMKRMDIDSSYFYIQVIDYQREIAHSLNYVLTPLNEHLENQHAPFSPSQTGEVRLLVSEIDTFFNFALHVVREQKFDAVDELAAQKARISEVLSDIEKGQINLIKKREVNVRNSMLLLKALTEIKNLLAHTLSMIKSYRDFVLVSRKQG